jgi:CubicO group peptidase (beta-lactamase class C family)
MSSWVRLSTGHPYGDYLRDRIFRPLGMSHTHVIDLDAIIPDRASGYSYHEEAFHNAPSIGQAHAGGPDVGVMASAGDVARWMMAVSNGRLWTSVSRDQMWTPVRLGDGRDAVSFPAASGYGLGWVTGRYRGHAIVGHSGSLLGAFASVFLMIPEKHLGVVVLTNQSDCNPAKIAFGIFGLKDPSLRPPHQRGVEHDRDVKATARDAAFIDAYFRGRHHALRDDRAIGASVRDVETSHRQRTASSRRVHRA